MSWKPYSILLQRRRGTSRVRHSLHAKGLQNHELCLYITHENPVAKILNEFKHAGVDTEAAMADGALKIATVKETYLRHGIFEPTRMIADLDDEVSTALRAGRSGLQVTGEMSWALDLPSAVCQLCCYEEALRQTMAG